ncbi:MAG: choice-of-anchor D domain-containing protein [Bacteroidetes bacterium]|nr:choice-of-anchor D domain-containing protein [Bacteroidota bacterium]
MPLDYEKGDEPMEAAGQQDVPDWFTPKASPAGFIDPLLQSTEGTVNGPDPFLSFDGPEVSDNPGGLAPPDPNIAVGPNHIVASVNVVTEIYDKTGNSVLGPFLLNDLWSGFGGPCEADNDGDPIALYDHFNDRFVLTQFAVTTGAHLCVAVSTSPDPTGSYNLYEFDFITFPDYPKFGITSDALLASVRNFGASFDMQAAAMDYPAMLVGDPATLIITSITDVLGDVDGFLPIDAESDINTVSNIAVGDTPGNFVGFQDGPNTLEFLQLDPDFDTPGNSTLTSVNSLPVDPFDSSFCGGTFGGCIDQPAPGNDVDALSFFLMHRASTRMIDGDLHMVINHTVDVDGTDRAGIRWYELADTGAGGDWEVVQSGTFSPDTNDRWMGSASFNGNGDILIGYSTSGEDPGDTTPPDIRYAAQTSGAAPGFLNVSETTILEGPGVQTGGLNRWGDYTSMVPDPSDPNTTWYINQYIPSDGSFNWKTHIAGISLEGDDTPPDAITDLSATLPASISQGSNVLLEWTATGDDGNTGTATSYDIRYSTAGPITTETDFDNATEVDGEPAPQAAGSAESFTVEGLDFDTQFWFAIKALDEFGNASDVSNSPDVTTGPAPDLALNPTELDVMLEPEESTVETLTITNNGAAGSTLNFQFPAFAASALLENTPDDQKNDVSSVIGSTDHQKGDDPFGGIGNPIILGAGGPDDFGYEWIDSNEPGGPAFDFVDISGTGTPLGLGDDDGTTVSLPFTFPFYGEDKTEIGVSSNGFLTFGTDLTDLSNDEIPDPNDPNDLISVYWDDLDPGDSQGGGGEIYHQDMGDGRFIVQWDAVPHFPDGDGETSTFQAILYDDGTILLQYDSMTDDASLPNSHTIGIENSDASDGLQVVFNAPYVEDQLAIQIAVPPDIIGGVDPASGSLASGASVDVDVTVQSFELLPGNYEDDLVLESNDPGTQPTTLIPVMLEVAGGTPDIAVDPASLDFGDVFVGGSTSATFDVSNEGNGILEVTDISSTNGDFTTDFGSGFTLNPGESATTTVTFTPSSQGTITGSIDVGSTDPDEDPISVAVEGNGTAPPEIDTDPDALTSSLQIGDSETQTLTVQNNGAATLDFEASVDFSGGSAPDWDFSNDADYPVGSHPPSYGPAPLEGKSATPAPNPLDPVGSLAYGVDNAALEFSSFDFGEPGNVTSIAPFTGAGGFAGASAIGGDPNITYVIDGTTLFEVDNTTGASTNLGSLSPSDGADFSGLTYDPNSDTFYGITVPSCGGGSNLHTVDVENVSSSLVGPVNTGSCEIAVAATPDGTLYSFDIVGDVLLMVDKTTGAGTVIGPIGFDSNFGQGMTYDLETETLYMAAFNNGTFQAELRAVDTSTGATALVGPIGTPGVTQFGQFAAPLGAGGFLQVSPQTASVPPGGSVDLDVTFDATDLDVGTYEADVVLASNDPATPELAVPATLNVEAAPFPFALTPTDFDVDLFTGDIVVEELNIENTTDEQQPFELAIEGESGPDPVGPNPLTELERREYDKLAHTLAQGDQTAPTAGADPDADNTLSADFPSSFGMVAPTGVTAYGSSVSFNGNFDGNLVAFDLGEPSSLTALTPDPFAGAFAGDFPMGDNENFFVIDDDTKELFLVDVETGSETLVGSVSVGAGESVSELATDPTDGTMYLSTSDGTSSFLYEVDPTVGPSPAVATTPIGEIGTDIGIVIAIAVDDAGVLYAHEIGGDVIYTVDKTNGDATLLGPTGVDANFAQGMDFDPVTGQLYMAWYQGGGVGGLRTVDRSTGATTLVGPFQGDEIGFLAIPSTLPVNFLDLSLTEGTLNPGRDVDVDVEFDATNLIEGLYTAEIIVQSFVPGEPAEIVPVEMTVDADPEIDVTPLAVDFGEVFRNGTGGPENVVIANTGLGFLEVSDISVDNPAFDLTLPTVSTTIPPLSAIAVEVTFNPTELGVQNGTITIESDDADESTVQVSLTGEGVPEPVISLDPDEFNLQAYVGQTYDQTLTVNNVGDSGGDPLEWTLTEANADGPGNAIFNLPLLDEDFEGGVLPSGWTRTQDSGADGWLIGDDLSSFFFNIPPNTIYAASNDDACNCDSDNDYLITPSLDLSGVSSVELEFDSFYNGSFSQLAFVEVSLDGGTTWQVVEQMTASSEWTRESIDLSAFAGESDVLVGFHADDAGVWASGWAVDDVLVQSPLEWITEAPTSGSVAPGASEDVTLSFDASGLPTGLYEVDLVFDSNDPVNPQVTVPVDFQVISEVTVTANTDELYEENGNGTAPTPVALEEVDEIHPGQEYLFPVTVTSLNFLEIFSYEFTLHFDPAITEAVDAVFAGTLSEGLETAVTVDNSAGTISVAAADDEDDSAPIVLDPTVVEGQGTLLYVKMQVGTDIHGTSPMEFQDTFMFNEGEPPVLAVDGEIESTPLYGDASMNVEVTGFDASLALRYAANDPGVSFTDAAFTQADVTGNDEVTGFDASFILRFASDAISCFPVEDGCSVPAKRSQDASGVLAWGEPQNESSTDMTRLPLTLEQVDGEVNALTLTLPIDDRIVSFEGLETSLPDDWQTAHAITDGALRIAMAGATPLSGGDIATLNLRWLTDDAQMTFTGPYVVNENTSKALNGVDVGTVPDTYALGDNYPNPFNPVTTITYELPEQTRVTLTVYNALGQKVRTLVDTEQSAGRYKVRWDSQSDSGARLASGTYLYRIEAGDFVETKTLILIK